jgi:2-desacetyl-2-hydroxyethyl bacteriochlorophyllide A dehydrogenase
VAIVTTREAVIEAPERVVVRTTPPGATLGPGEARVRSVVVGICGSDVHAYRGVHPFIDLPVVPGHEVVGIVENVGADVRDLVPGTRVLLEANVVDGTCRYCRAGVYNQCEHLLVVGCQMPGAMADRFVVPAAKLIPVPDDVADDDAAIVEPLASGTHAIRLADGVEGKRVAVLGTGTIGLLTVAAARASGASTIATTDLVGANRERALAMGADAAIDPTAGSQAEVADALRDALGERPDVTFDCVAVQATVDLAVDLAQRGGTVLVLGVPTDRRSVALPLVQDREIRLQGSAMYVRRDVERALEIVRAGGVDIRHLVTGRFSLDDAAEAFAAAATTEHVKVQVYVGEPNNGTAGANAGSATSERTRPSSDRASGSS